MKKNPLVIVATAVITLINQKTIKNGHSGLPGITKINRFLFRAERISFYNYRQSPKKSGRTAPKKKIKFPEYFSKPLSMLLTHVKIHPVRKESEFI